MSGAWEEVASNLGDSGSTLSWNVDGQGVRKRFDLLMRAFKAGEQASRRGSGVAEDFDEVQELLQEIYSVMEEKEKEKVEKEEKNEEEKRAGERVRDAALKRFTEKEENWEKESPSKKKKRKENEVLASFLAGKAELEGKRLELQKEAAAASEARWREEMEIRKIEAEARKEEAKVRAAELKVKEEEHKALFALISSLIPKNKE